MDLISVEEAARILGVSGRRVRVLIKEGRLLAWRVGRRTYAVARAEAELFGETPRPTGRPRISVVAVSRQRDVPSVGRLRHPTEESDGSDRP